METVRTAAERALAEARLIELPNHTTSDFPVPAVHGVNSYLLRMRGGLRSAHHAMQAVSYTFDSGEQARPER